MRLDLTLAPGATVDGLTLEIPLRDEAAPLLHAMGDGIRNTLYTQVPAGPGRRLDEREGADRRHALPLLLLSLRRQPGARPLLVRRERQRLGMGSQDAQSRSGARGQRR